MRRHMDSLTLQILIQQLSTTYQVIKYNVYWVHRAPIFVFMYVPSSWWDQTSY